MMKKVITVFMGLALMIGCQKEETIIIDNQNPITIKYQDYKVDILEVVQNYEIRAYSSFEGTFIKAPADSIFVDVVATVSTDKEFDEKIWLEDIEYGFNTSDIKPYGLYIEVNNRSMLTDSHIILPNTNYVVHFVGVQKADELLTEIPFDMGHSFLIKADYNNYQTEFINNEDSIDNDKVAITFKNIEYISEETLMLVIDVKNKTEEDILINEALLLKDKYKKFDDNVTYSAYEQKGEDSQRTNQIPKDTENRYYIYLYNTNNLYDSLSFMFLDNYYTWTINNPA